ncbi:MAG: phage tail protein [Chloroflexi bacterium]|nr:MAG: phage tail protein [Chloroflexota bacterium]
MTDPPLGITGTRLEPLLTYQFSVTFGNGAGQFVAHAIDVSGLDFERAYIEHKYVNQQYQAVTQMIPGRIKWNPITLKRLLTTDTAMWDWFMDHEGSSVNTGSYTPKKYAAARLPVTIVAYNRNFTEAIRWELSNAWPSKITGPQFDVKSGDFGFEEVTLVFESVKRTVTAGTGSVEALAFIAITGEA